MPQPAPPSFCPIEAGMFMLSGKWRGRILMKLHTGTVRFAALRRSLPGISEKVLAQQLRDLEKAGLVTRTPFPEVPPRVEYALSAFGQTLQPVLDTIIDWAQAHRAPLGARPSIELGRAGSAAKQVKEGEEGGSGTTSNEPDDGMRRPPIRPEGLAAKGFRAASPGLDDELASPCARFPLGIADGDTRDKPTSASKPFATNAASTEYLDGLLERLSRGTNLLK